jgi:WD40 repeat protein
VADSFVVRHLLSFHDGPATIRGANVRLFQGRRRPVLALSFSADSRHLAVADGAGLTVLDVAATKAVKQDLGCMRGPTLAVYLPDGRVVVGGSDDLSVFVEPTVSGGFVGFYPNVLPGPVLGLSASADGVRLVGVGGELRSWTMTDRLPKHSWRAGPPRDETFGAAAISPSGRSVVVGRFKLGQAGGRLDVYDARSGRWLRQLTDALAGPGPLCWSPDGTAVATLSDRRLALFAAADGRKLAEATNAGRHALSSLVFDPAGRFLLVGCLDGTVRRHDPTSGAMTRSEAWRLEKVRSMAIAPDGKTAAAGGNRGQVALWDVGE